MEERIWHRHYDEGIPRSLEYEELPVTAFLRRSAERHPHATALVFVNAKLQYRELQDEVDRFAGVLSRLGVAPGTCVALMLPNLPQTVISYYAALSLGARVVMTNPLYTTREVEHQWKDAGCELAVVADFLYESTLREHRAELPIRDYVLASIPDYMRAPLRWFARFALQRKSPPAWAPIPQEAGVHSFRELIKSATPAPPRPQPDFDEVAVLQYTGGTTGVSKAAMLTHRNLSVNVQQANAWVPGLVPGRDVVLVCIPLFHVFGMTVGMNSAIHTAGAMVLEPNPRDTARLVDSIEKHRVNVFPGVPALYNSLNHFPGIESRDVRSLERCVSGSAPLPLDVQERFEALTGAKVLEGFGMTETSPVTHINPFRGERKTGSVGIPLPDTDARIVDVEDGKTELPPGAEGELLVHGPQVMKGYWNQPDETAKALVDGWLHTGDLAVCDDDGYFRIVGRKKDMINVSGLKVFPDEVDQVLIAHDAILEAATIGVPHPTHGDTVKSFVVLRPGATLTEQDVITWCRDKLARYKVPRAVEFLDELPKSTVMKVLRRELLEREMKSRQSA